MKILVRATNWIGDAVMSLPALRAIRSRFPQAEIAVLAKPWVADLYAGETVIDRVIPIDAGRRFRQAWLLRAERFDLAVLFPNSFDSAAAVFLTGARRRVGYARDGRGWLLTDAIPCPEKGAIPAHERFYYLELLRRAGLLESLPEESAIRLEDAAAARERGRELLAARGLRGFVVGVSPGAAYGTAKRWLPERFAEAAARLGSAIAVFGSGAERDLCEEVARLCRGHNLAGRTTLREFMDMTAACDVFLTNDSGAMHIASASGVPSVTIFGPTDEFGTGPSGASSALVREPVECAPCKLRECPIDHRCMTGITVDRVVDAALATIGKSASRC